LAADRCPVVDACTSFSSGDCPVESGETIVYDIEMKVVPDTIFFPVSLISTDAGPEPGS
jgi:hypothetical protein